MSEAPDQSLNDAEQLHGLAACAEAVERLLCEAQGLVQLLSRDLDPRVYATREAVDALRAMCLRHRNARVELLVIEPRRASARPNPLIRFARMLTSRVHLREPGEGHAELAEELLIVDGRSVFGRVSADSTEAWLQRRPAEARLARRRFAEYWDHAVPTRELTTLGL